jgi:hypothetical protein
MRKYKDLRSETEVGSSPVTPHLGNSYFCWLCMSTRTVRVAFGVRKIQRSYNLELMHITYNRLLIMV